MTAGERIKERRKELGISAEHVAEKLGVSPATIYRYENGEIEKIPSNVLDGISKVLQTTPAFLMGCDAEQEIAEAAAAYRKMLSYAITGCKSLLWKTAFDLNRPELGAPMAQEIVFNLQQMAADLAEYEAEAARLGCTGEKNEETEVNTCRG